MSTPYYEQEASYEFRNQVVTFRNPRQGKRYPYAISQKVVNNN